MKTRLTLPKFLIVLCGIFAATAVFGQTTFTWTNAAGGLITTAANWDPNGQPNGNDGSSVQQTALWDGRTPSDLIITNTSASLPNTGYNTIGINLALTANQTKNVQFVSAVAGGSSAQIGLFCITNDSPNASIILGDFNTPASLMRLTGRPAGATHYYVNNSKGPAIINPSVEWQAGGGTAYTMEFGGTGDWIVRSSLRNDNGSGGTGITVDGPGMVAWTNGTKHVAQDPVNLITISDGKLVLQGPGLLPDQANNSTITINGGSLVFDAGSQSDTISRTMAGATPGVLQVNSGTLTLSSANSTFSGDINLTGGELVVAGTETPDTFGPLGAFNKISFKGGTLGFSANNIFDYSSRFDPAAGQAYSFDSGGQNVSFTNGLSSSGGTLTKVGSGTLTLAGPSSYSGATTVSVGKLVFQGLKSGSGNITVADSAILGITAAGAPITPGTLALGTSAGATLEFNNVTSTATAPLAAGTLSASGTVIININSGTFTVGQSYPLLTWTTGSAPSVSLGTLNGSGGNLSTNGNTIQLNITGAAFRWTGGNNGSWDTTTTGNWIQSGGPAVFANGSPVLFDDTSTRTSVTVGALVQPTSVTVDVNTNAYTITSSSGKDIGGSASLTKSSSGMLTLSGGANAYTGSTKVSGGTLSVGTLANGGSTSDIGAASSSAANLVLNGGTLQYTGGGASIDRLFTLTTAGGTIDASGSGALNLNNTGSLGYSGTGPRVLSLTGADTHDNTFAASLADNGGITTLTKNGTGNWILAGTNTYSGVTTIAAGMLQVGAGGASGSLGSGNIVNNGGLDFNRTGSLTVSGAISGTGSVTNDGSGTVILAGNNNYTGGTTINAGTLQVGSGGGTGTLDINAGVVNNSTLLFNSTAAFTLNGIISGTGNLIKQGPGLLKLLGNNTFTGWTRVDPGGVLQICSGNQGAFAGPVITNNGSLLFVRQDNATFIYSGNIVGTGSVTKEANNDNSGDATLTGTNTYTGGTFIKAGGIILGDGITPGAGSIVGNVIFTNSSVSAVVPRTLTFNRPDDFTFGGNIVGAVSGSTAALSGSVVQNGFGVLTLTGANTYPGGTTINQGTVQVGAGGTSGSLGAGDIADNTTLVFNRSDNVTLPNVISGVGSIVKLGSGTLTLTASNTYSGSTTVSNGTLVINGDNLAVSTIVNGGTLGGTATLSGPVTLDAGTTLAPGASVGSVGTLTINSDLTIGGNLAIEVNKSLSPSSDLVVVSGALSKTGSGTLTVANLGPALAVGNKFTLFSQPVQNGAALTVTGGGATWINNLAVDGSISVASVLVVTPPTLGFTRTGNSLQFSWTGSFTLQAQTNSINVGLSTNWADYGTSPVTVPMDVTKGTIFFRLLSTP